MKLIFDRTEQDKIYVETLRDKILANGFNSLTNEEKTNWLSCTLKGAYNYTDRNRVENAVKQINEKLIEYNYMSEVLEIVENRDITAIDDKQSANRYLDNIQKLINNFYILTSTPTLPESLDNIDINVANNIEKILNDLYIIIKGLENNFIHSGVANCGQVRFWQQRFRITEHEYIYIGFETIDGNTFVDVEDNRFMVKE